MMRDKIFRRMPLFFVGLSCAIGSYSYLAPSYGPIFLVLGCVLALFLRPRHTALLAVMCALGFWYAFSSVKMIPLGSSSFGAATCYMTECMPCTFHKKAMYRCEMWIDSFVDTEGREVARGLRATLFQKPPIPFMSNKIYRIPGMLKRERGFLFQMRPKGCSEAIGERVVSSVETRSKVREFFQKALEKTFHDQEAIQLIGTMCFSLPCGQDVRREIHKVGLDHVLGVSGIHFTQLAILVAVIASLFRRWIYSCITWGFLTLFFMFVGPLPAVFRAWVSSTICIGQRVFGRNGYGLNTLGAGLIVLMLFDPLTLSTLSLQLSFLATGAILIGYRPRRKFCEKLLPTHSAKDLFHFSFFDQIFATVIQGMKSTLSIVLSISLVMVPYQLAFMPDMPLMGLIANLFLPIFFDIALIATFFVLLIAMVIPPLGTLLGYLMEKYIQVLMHVVREMPNPLWTMVQGVHLHEEVAVLIIGLTIILGAVLSVYKEYTQDDGRASWLMAI